MSTFTLIMRNGNRVKLPYMLIKDKEYVTEHFSRKELDTGHDENAMFYKPTLELIEEIRKRVGGPVQGNSGYRSRLKQTTLYNNYLAECKAKGVQPVPGKVAKPGNSPHETGAAADLGIPAGFTEEGFAKLAQKASVDLGFPMARVGWKKYHGENFIHVDLVFMLFEPYTEVKNPFPQLWIPGLTW